MFANVPCLRLQSLSPSWFLDGPCSRVYAMLSLFIATRRYGGPGEAKSCLSTFLALLAPGRRLMEGRQRLLDQPALLSPAPISPSSRYDPML